MAALWEVATRLAHEFITDDFIAQERKNVAEIYLPNTDTWVAEIEGAVKGFIALMGNEVGAIFLQPSYHGNGVGKSLMDTAQELHRDLEVEVFRINSIGRKFYSQYGFEYLNEKLHELSLISMFIMVMALKISSKKHLTFFSAQHSNIHFTQILVPLLFLIILLMCHCLLVLMAKYFVKQ